MTTCSELNCRIDRELVIFNMKVSKRINKIRASLLRSLTKNIGQKKKHSKDLFLTLNSSFVVKKILVSRPNSRLGNQLLITPLIQELEYLFPQAKIDLFVRGGITSILFRNYECIDRIISLPKKPFDNLWEYIQIWLRLRKYKYDLVINTVENSSSGRLSTKISKGHFKFFNDIIPELEEAYGDYNHIAKRTVYNLRTLLSDNILINNREIAPLDIKLSVEEKLEGGKIISSIFNNSKKTIGIYTFATGDKCYSEEWWKNLYGLLKQEFAYEFNILEVLPVENSSQIDFEAPSYYSKDIREIAGVIHNLSIFISADCGIMHLASASATPVVGLFSVTNLDVYRPYRDSSVAVDTNNSTHEDIIHIVKNILNK